MSDSNLGNTIVLSDDDDVTIIDRKSGKGSGKWKSECLNPSCKNGVDFCDSVPELALSYFRVKRKKYLKICKECFNEVSSHYAALIGKFKNDEPLSRVQCPDYPYIMNVDDSDEEEEVMDDDEVLDNETCIMIEESIDQIIKKRRSQVEFQVAQSVKAFNDRVGVVKSKKQKCQYFPEECFKGTYISNKSRRIIEVPDDLVLLIEIGDIANIDLNCKEMQQQIDTVRDAMYKEFRPIYKELPPIEIIDDFTEQCVITVGTPEDRSVEDVNAENKKTENSQVIKETDAQTKLTVSGSSVDRPQLEANDFVYFMKHSYRFGWKRGVINSIVKNCKGNTTVTQYLVSEESSKKSNSMRTVSGRSIAYDRPPSQQVEVGNRVIAGYREERNSSQMEFFSGVVAEPPKRYNQFRYLLFFDDGYTQYVPHEDVRLIVEPSEHAWDDVPVECKPFISKYLNDYPQRPMMKLHNGNRIKVEYNHKWMDAEVTEVDASLAKLSYKTDGRKEWIYRGSLRFLPLYKLMVAEKHRLISGDRVRKAPSHLTNDPYVEYTLSDDEEYEEDDNLVKQVAVQRAVARKSTMQKDKQTPSEKPLKWTPIEIPGEIKHLTLKDVPTPLLFRPHQCGPDCIARTGYESGKLTTVGPLAIPLHFGFRRLIYESDTGNIVVYQGPCGRMLRSIGETHTYLRVTKSQMTVDLFDFDHWVNVLDHFVIERANINIPDITQQKERCPISCVNYIDNEIPNFIGYMTEREPKEGVSLNLDPEFLTSCDCTDDCKDKTKCSCWKLTIEGQNVLKNPQFYPDVGYQYRRLSERVITGIYECNQNCKCSKMTCLNRVVQYPLSQKLQLFKTEMKGWGIRCLNDIPQGAFICIYAGYLLTEQVANEEGKVYGDEYLAELDFIEVIENLKNDYEDDVPNEVQEEIRKFAMEQDNADDSESSCSTGSSSSSSLFDTSDDKRMKLRERIKLKGTVDASSKQNSAENKENEVEKQNTHCSVRKYYGSNEDEVFIMDAKSNGNIGRYLNHSCSPNVFVQSVFVDTHDLRFPWVSFFALTFIQAGKELTWDYNYEVGSVEGKLKYCYCGSENCRRRLL